MTDIFGILYGIRIARPIPQGIGLVASFQIMKKDFSVGLVENSLGSFAELVEGGLGLHASEHDAVEGFLEEGIEARAAFPYVDDLGCVEVFHEDIGIGHRLKGRGLVELLCGLYDSHFFKVLIPMSKHVIEKNPARLLLELV